jgi:6-phosphogluconate dehydrogenase
MQVGIVGLGHMGANLARQALAHGHRVVGFDPSPDATGALRDDGLQPADSLAALVAALDAPRTVLVWVPHGDPTEHTVEGLRGLLEPGDLVVDGGNSHWGDSMRRHSELAKAGVRFLDVGTSGGVEGAREGAAFMAGGEAEAFERVTPLLRDLAVDDHAVYHAGPAGAGHFVKLVHNAIEFGMVQAIAEGVEMLDRSDFPLDLPRLFDHWQHGSVIRGWLTELMGEALAREPDFAGVSTYVEDTDEVKWVLEWTLRADIPAPVVSAAQTALMSFRDLDWPAAKAHALLRNAYGGHPVHRRGEAPGSDCE